MGDRRHRDIPANGVAQGLAPRGLAQQLGAKADGHCGAHEPLAVRATGQHEDDHHRDARMHDAGQTAVVGERRLDEQAQVRQRPGREPGPGHARRHQRRHAEHAGQRHAGQVADEMIHAVVHAHGRERAPGLAERERGLPVDRVVVQRPTQQCAGAQPCGEADPGETEARHDADAAPTAARGESARASNTACHSASTASRWPAIASDSTWVVRSSSRARCWARRNSR